MEKLNRRVLVFVSNKNNFYLSCEILIKNFLSFLSLSVENFELAFAEESKDSIQLKIESYNPDSIIILDNSIELGDLFGKLKLPIISDIKIFLFVYGLFYLRADELVRALKDCDVKNLAFVCFSSIQKKQFDSFFIGDSLIYSPPISYREFFYDESFRQIMRTNYGFTEKDKVFVYSGRVSEQKNIDLLLNSFIKAKNSDSHLKLFIIGESDESWRLSEKRESFKSLDDIFFIDHNISQAILNHYYCMSDCFISLSKHHDEIYGLSAREALSCGLDLILSDWGGHKELFENENVYKVNFDSSEVSKKMLSLIPSRYIGKSKAKKAEIYLEEQLSCVKKMLDHEFKDFENKNSFKFNILDKHKLSKAEYDYLYHFFK